MVRFWVLLQAVLGGRLNDLLDTYLESLTLSSSLLEEHLTHTHTSGLKKKRRYRDLDCDSVEADSDQIEQVCHEYRYKMLRDLAPTIEGLDNNRTVLVTHLSELNDTTKGTIQMGLGLFPHIDWNNEAMYNGFNQSKVKPILSEAFRLSKKLEQLSNVSNAVLDTQWSNLKTTTDALADNINDFSLAHFVYQLEVGMNLGQLGQMDMAGYFRDRSANTSVDANGWLAALTKSANDFQAGLQEQMIATETARKTNYDKQIKGAQDAADTLDDVTNFFLTEVPNRNANYIDNFKKNGMQTVKDARDTFFKEARAGLDPITRNWQREESIFDSTSAANFAREKKDWDQSERQRMGDFAATFTRFNRMNSDALSDTKLADANDVARMNDLATNMTDTVDTYVYAAQDAVTKTSSQLKTLEHRGTVANTDIAAEFNKLLSQLGDGTTDMQSKISSFLKLSSDSNAGELAALVQSAAAMRDSLSSSQSGKRADMDNLIASLQAKLARKAQDEGSVSLDVERTLAIGSEAALAKLKAAADFQKLTNAEAAEAMSASAGEVLDSIMEDSLGGALGFSTINADMMNALKTNKAFVDDESELSEAEAKQALYALQQLMASQAGASGKSSGDASAAARAVLQSLAAVRDGSLSTRTALAARAGSLGDKLSAIASQLGMSDEGMQRMYGKLLKTIGSSADSQIQAVVGSRLTSSKSEAGKLGAGIAKSVSDSDDSISDTEIAQQRAADVDARFKEKLGSISSALDSQFANRLDRDNAVRIAVRDGLGATRDKLLVEATKAVNAGSSARQAFADDAGSEADAKLSSFGSEIRNLAKSQFSQISDLATQVAASKSIRRTSELDLEKASSAYYSYVEEANRRIGAEGVVLDEADKYFATNASSIWNGGSKEQSDLTKIDAFKNDLMAFMKTVPQKVSREMGAIQDAFLLTDQQIAFKARMLQSLAAGEMTDEERAAVNAQLDSLQQSQALMVNFKEVQRQALNAVFAKNSGLLGQADGSVGNLNEVANSISRMLNSNQKLNNQIDQTFDNSNRDARGMTAQMNAAIDSTQSTLARSIADAGSQAAFSSNITNAQVGSLIDSAGRDGDLDQRLANDVSNSSDQAIAAKQQRLKEFAAMLESNRDQLSEQVTKTLRLANTSDDELKRRVENDAAEKAAQLTIVKNAVEQLLQTWYHYTSAQNRKFARWNKTEDEYVGQFQGSMAFMNQSAMTQVAESSRAVSLDDDLSQKAISDFVAFQNKLSASDEQVRDAVAALNVSTESSVDQLGEMIFKEDNTDKDYDDQARQAAEREGVIATNTANAQMKEIIDSLKTSSLIELDVDPEALRSEIADVDEQLNPHP